MKLLLFTIFLCLLSFPLTGQNCRAILQEGARALQQKGDTETALRKLQDTEVCDLRNSLIKERQRLQNAIFDTLRQQKIAVENARKATAIALQQAKRLTDAFYFYANRYALAYGELEGEEDPLFYYIDKRGEKVNKLGQWTKAEQFDQNGLARIEVHNVDAVTTIAPDQSKESITYAYLKSKFLIDTLGRKYTFTEKLGELKSSIHLQAFDGSFQKYSELPPVVLNQLYLKVLLLQYNNIRKVPNDIQKLKYLRQIDLGGNRLSQLPKQLCRLENLETLSLHNNQIRRFDVQVGCLQKLKVLNLAQNFLYEISFADQDLQNLVELDLSQNSLGRLPPNIGVLAKLEVLHLQSTAIKSVPLSIGDLQWLKELNLASNLISRLPPEISNLKRLRKLNLSSNPIPELERKRIRQWLPDTEIQF